MAGRKSTEPKQAILQMPRTEAENRLKDRIARGKQLLELNIAIPGDLEEARAEYRKWSDYNHELLRRIVDTEDFVNSYSDAIFFGGGNLTFREKVLDFVSDVNKKIRRLESILERLELIPEASHLTQETIQAPAEDTADIFSIKINQTRLLQIIDNLYNLDDFRTLCYELGVDMDNLAGESKIGKARELILSLAREAKLLNLIFKIHQKRPDFSQTDFS
ncbi:MAG: hypothetical protein KC421_05050 [Anaerolineales bacterium]|nr:hypothetical protein [Anaerolineales bacterium]